MASKKEKICKVPKCKKEVHASKAFFCGEHEREYRDKGKKFGKGALAVGSIVGSVYSLAIALSDSVRKKNN